MAYRGLAKKSELLRGPTAPRKRHFSVETSKTSIQSFSRSSNGSHPLTDEFANNYLQDYETEVKDKFDQIVPLLKKVSALQHEQDFVGRAQQLSLSELGYLLPEHLLSKAWVKPLDMRALFAWCVFQSH